MANMERFSRHIPRIRDLSTSFGICLLIYMNEGDRHGPFAANLAEQHSVPLGHDQVAKEARAPCFFSRDRGG